MGMLQFFPHSETLKIATKTARDVGSATSRVTPKEKVVPMASSNFNAPSTHNANLLRFPRANNHAHTAGSIGKKKSQTMPAVIVFPKQGECPACHKPANPVDLSNCTACGQQFCDDNDCDWSCRCTKIADMVESRIARRMNETSSPLT